MRSSRWRRRRAAFCCAEAPDRIAWHVSRQIERALADVGDADRVEVGLSIARALLERLGELLATDTGAAPSDPARVLHAILRRQPDGTAEEIDEPLIPL